MMVVLDAAALYGRRGVKVMVEAAARPQQSHARGSQKDKSVGSVTVGRGGVMPAAAGGRSWWWTAGRRGVVPAAAENVCGWSWE